MRKLFGGDTLHEAYEFVKERGSVTPEEFIERFDEDILKYATREGQLWYSASEDLISHQSSRMYAEVFDILTEARDIVTQDRSETHGDIQDNHDQIAAFWSAYLGVEIDATDVALMMIMLKISRASVGMRDRDHFVDMAGYASIGGALDDSE